MYKRAAFGSVLGFLALVQAQTAFASDSAVPGDFSTIQEAIDDAGTVAGDTITVSGAHAESNVMITKSVIIAGGGIGSTVIGLSAGEIGFRPLAGNITIRDMTIEGGSQAIRFEDAGGTINGTTILRVEMLNQTSRGIEVHNDTTITNLVIEMSEFIGSGGGLRVSSSGHLDGAKFLNSTFDGNTIGIYVANDGGTSTAKDILVNGSTFKNITAGQGTAIYVEEIQDALIEENEFIDNRRDIQIFKWYQASLPVSNVVIRNNTMTGTANAVFAIFNAEHSSGPTEFDGITFSGNTADTDDGSAVFAGAFDGYPGGSGIGWDTVMVTCNTFLGITAAGNGVRFFNPGGLVPAGQELGGASIDVAKNWWGTADEPTVEALLEEPSITIYLPILDEAPTVFCEAIDVVIDIKPGNPTNTINPGSKGVIQVAILTTGSFDATMVDPGTVRFGPNEAAQSRSARIKDVNHDGDKDLLLHFRMQDTGVASGDPEACLIGLTSGGESIAGCDDIRTVGK